MAMTQPFRNERKTTVFFSGIMLQLQDRNIATTALKREGNDNSSCGRILSVQSRSKKWLQISQVLDQNVDSSAYDSLLQGCLDNKNLPEAKLVHAHMIQTGFKCRDISLGNKLVTMYAKCGNMVDADGVFNQMPERDVVSWTAMIVACARHGYSEEALALFRQMQRTGIQPNGFTFAGVLPACANLESLEQGMEIHQGIMKFGFQSNVFVENALVNMYAKCGCIKNARHVFDKMPQRDVVSWTSMIAGYAQNGLVDEALKLFQKMPEQNMVSWTTMIVAFAQDGRVDEALELFCKMSEQDVVSWTAMIAGYAQNGHGEKALKLFRQMKLAGVKANAKTFASVLPACANLADLELGMEIHEEINRSGFQSDIFVQSALVDMYAKCGRIENACDLFEKMHQRNVVSWTAMIGGYAQNGRSGEALQLFQQMQLLGVKPNAKTFVSVLPACANLAALEQGKEIHEEIIRYGFETHVFVGNGLVNMYAKCGCIEYARRVFDKINQRNVVSWNAMIAGYALHGHGEEALKLFEQMQCTGTSPNHVTLVCVLSACCHAGLVDEGRKHFNCMSQHYHVIPALEHYGCMVDLLGRAGHLYEALDFIEKMPMKPDANVWRSLLGACRVHNNIELGEHVAKHLFELDPKNATTYVLLSNMYAAAGRWDDIEKVRKMMKDKSVEKTPGCSWIEVNKQVYAFLVEDKSHPQTEKIHAELERLSRQMKVAGYVPNMSWVLNDVEEEQKEQILCHHSEKLAIAFGLISTSSGAAIRVIKNLRVCGDCHTAIKFISKIVAREIVVRDANRFHHFNDGWCSCGDYW
eukprot:Gb_20195 [translate_table: standard]